MGVSYPKPEVVVKEPSSPAIAEPEAVVSTTKTSAHQKLAGKTIVITGKLKTLSSDRAQSLIEGAGGTINEHPSSQTSYVVVGENPGKKLKKAEKHNVPQLTEAQLLELLGVED
ncbi:MAG: hypothetical protein HC852_11365 [Acaryochloridaceae cyanobacterium RU_4_10]|nr:hypothetical protein [Acaryochloridaceae cyanobacterium RU_4_10]